MNLIELLNQSPAFQALPSSDKEMYLKLADVFDENDLALHLTPLELHAKLGIGNKNLWQSFLQLEPVKNYIKQQMQFNAQIASRKAFAALTRSANEGNTSAAQQVNQLSGILNQDSNKVIILHRVDRPKENMPKEPPSDVDEQSPSES